MKLDYLHLAAQCALPRQDARPFRAVLIADSAVDAGWRNEVAVWLVDSGCLYLVAWGESCEFWHDDVDRAVLDKFGPGQIPDDRFVMTTWDDDEPLSEALWYAGNCAWHPDVDLEETLLVHVSGNERRAAILEAYRDSQTG